MGSLEPEQVWDRDIAEGQYYQHWGYDHQSPAVTLDWSCHLNRWVQNPLPTFLQWINSRKTQSRVPQEEKYKDNLKANLKWAGIEPKELETATSNRSVWHATTMSATRNFENNRRLCIAAARDHWKRAANNPITTRGTPCPICNCMCDSKFGLQSHMRAHRWHLSLIYQQNHSWWIQTINSFCAMLMSFSLSRQPVKYIPQSWGSRLLVVPLTHFIVHTEVFHTSRRARPALLSVQGTKVYFLL